MRQVGSNIFWLILNRAQFFGREILRHPEVKLDILDFENGWTPLHRALYFKNFRVALLLLKAGAKLGDEFSGDWRSSLSFKKDSNRSVRNWSRWTPNIDHEGNSPLDLLSCTLASKFAFFTRSLHTLMSFGRADLVLGVTLPTNSAEDILRPRRIDALESFTSAQQQQSSSRLESTIRQGSQDEIVSPSALIQVCASKYHSVVVTNTGQCYSWGHGRRGRLGHGDEGSCPEPSLIQSLFTAGVIITCVSTAENHTLALSDHGRLYSWGSNRFGQVSACATHLTPAY
jgi:hypothetical protein